MNILHVDNRAGLAGFAERAEPLAIVPRSAPEAADHFFGELIRDPFTVAGKVDRDNTHSHIKDIVGAAVPAPLKQQSAYAAWVSDMVDVTDSFCEVMGTESVCFWLGTDRGCRRYHVDQVPLRLLVTYAGQGTEWIPEEAADRSAFEAGQPNEKIVKDPSAKRFMKQWDIALFRGGSEGVLHRTPDSALGGPSILMRLDHPSFWDNVLRFHAR